MELTREVTAEREYVMAEGLVLTREEAAKQLAGADAQKTLYLVAEVGGRVVGQAGFFRGEYTKNAHTGQLWIVVAREHRGLGVGRAMMERGIAWARSIGIRKLKLRVFATNQRAQNLYRSMGFVEEARLRGDVIIDGRVVDDVLMALWMDGQRGPPPGSKSANK
ncbi:MAG: GNAT family N-acetyltransferase [Euryarchaeota archaeon]|nr:GNAT family N-acetyltransferase [Euryarchaeota archaeon]MDE1838035.1 GNAT family N-acetyltransferase [Euryarchaeota archaeon]MDE2046648.1 GNAT family N-acetyltransferase [Thermoplasmata archaeon]